MAAQQIYGSVTNYILAITGAALLKDMLLNAVTADPAFGSVMSNWSACMKKRGYKYDSPEKLWNTLAGQIAKAPTPALRGLEIKTAVADYRCSVAVKLVSTVRALQTQHAGQLSSTLLSSLASITQIESAALNKAKSLHLST